MLFADTLDIPAIIATSVPLAGILIGIIAVLAVNWRKAKVTECRAVMTQNMLDKGFTADEIERVLLANDPEGAQSVGKLRRDSANVR